MHESPEQPSVESQERYGENVTMHLHLIRHGEKGGKYGELTQKGRDAAREFGEERGSKAYHSDVHRNQQTAEEIAKGSEYKPRMKKNLAIYGENVAADWYDRYFESVHDGGQYDETRPIQELQFDIGRENRPDPDTVSSKEISARVAKELVHFVEMSKRLKSDSDVTIDLVSHTGIIEHVLVDLFDGDPETFLSEIGGGMRYLEGPEITVRREDKDTVVVEVTLDRELENKDGTVREVQKKATLTKEQLQEIADYIQETD
jgi:broad specificity phosphatase PhoE